MCCTASTLRCCGGWGLTQCSMPLVYVCCCTPDSRSFILLGRRTMVLIHTCCGAGARCVRCDMVCATWPRVQSATAGVVSGVIFLPYITFGKWDARRKQILIYVRPQCPCDIAHACYCCAVSSPGYCCETRCPQLMTLTLRCVHAVLFCCRAV